MYVLQADHFLLCKGEAAKYTNSAAGEGEKTAGEPISHDFAPFLSSQATGFTSVNRSLSMAQPILGGVCAGGMGLTKAQSTPCEAERTTNTK